MATDSRKDVLTEITPLEKSDCMYLRAGEKEMFSYPLHRHAEIEINFIENCAGRIRVVGDNIEELGQTELVLIGSNLAHAWEQPAGVRPQKMREITIQFHPNLLSGILQDKEQFRTIRDLIQRSQRGVAFGAGATRHVLELLENLARTPKGFYRYIRLLELLYELSQEQDYHLLSSSQFAEADISTDSRRINKAVHYIDKHFADVIRMPEVAALVGMTPTAFSRYFSRHTGRSFSDFVVEKRIGFATRQLVNTTDSVAEIGYAAGFSTLTNFNRLFKHRMGCTPKEFRANYNKRKIVIKEEG
ncbi:MAG: AraC family transcriptional regulator [Paludibacteraceae bacterium]